jgi:hypothetical protein
VSAGLPDIERTLGSWAHRRGPRISAERTQIYLANSMAAGSKLDGVKDFMQDRRRTFKPWFAQVRMFAEAQVDRDRVRHARRELLSHGLDPDHESVGIQNVRRFLKGGDRSGKIQRQTHQPGVAVRPLGAPRTPRPYHAARLRRGHSMRRVLRPSD